MLHGQHQVFGHDNKMTARQFLGKEEGCKGFTTVALYGSYLKSLRPTELADMTVFWRYIKEGSRIDEFVQQRKDRGGRTYIYPSFLQAKGNPKMKVILEAGMDQFIIAYSLGLVLIDFTLEDLIKEINLG